MTHLKFVLSFLVFFLFIALNAQSLSVDHTIKRGETLYSISKKYGVPIGTIKAANVGLSERLKIGSKIVIPFNPINVPTQKKLLNKGVKTHVVLQQGETFHSIARVHRVTVESVKALNPDKSEPFSIGDKLRIDAFYRSYPSAKENVIPKKFKTYIVKPKETIFNITRKEKVELLELLKYNPNLAFGLKAGMELLIPEPGIITETFGKRWISFENKKTIESSGIGTNKTINIVLMAPFYLKENTRKTILHKAKFATEFYLGATYALEFLRKKGMNIRMDVLDTERDSAKVLALLKKNDFSNTDLIIGPFYKGLSELVADQVKNIPIISPLSKTLDLTNRENLIQYITSDLYVHKKVLDLIQNEKQENELVIVKDSAQDVRFVLDYMSYHFKNLKVYQGHIADSLALSYDGKNVQFLFTSKNRKEIHKTLMNLKKAKNYNGFRVYNLFDNMSYRRLSYVYAKTLKFVIPKTMNSTKGNPYYKAFKNVFCKDMYMPPRVYELQGYDIVYDLVMRYSYNQNLFESFESRNSRQIQLMMNFLKQKNGGYMNDSSQLLRFTNGFQVIQQKKHSDKSI